MNTRTCRAAILAVSAATFMLVLHRPALSKGKPGGENDSSGTAYEIVMLTDGGMNITTAYAIDINEVGQIVGYANGAALWTIIAVEGDVQTTLQLLPDGQFAQAEGLNELGEIVGFGLAADGNEYGRYWRGAAFGPLDLPPLPGHDRSRARSISNDGVICGWSIETVFDSDGNPVGSLSKAVAWRINFDGESGAPVVWGPLELPSLGEEAVAWSLNDNDGYGVAQITGAVVMSTSTAVVWNVRSESDGTLTVAPTPDVLDENAVARGINYRGFICGDRGSPANEAVVWSGNSSIVLHRSRNVDTAIAMDLNFDGVIVGRGHYRKGSVVGNRAVLWPTFDGSMILLDKFLSWNSPFERLESARAVNDLSLVVGSGRLENSGEWRAYVAIPEFE